MESRVLNIYHETNFDQVLRCKQVLTLFRSRVESLLSDWPNNPILLDLLKVIGRVESFGAQDPLMKFLTGFELVAQKTQAWLLIESRDFSLDAEMRQVSSCIVDWRKTELDFWQKSSLEFERAQLKRKSSSHWFFHLFALCSGVDSQQNPFNQLNSFMERSSYGDFRTRLSQLKLCSQLFCRNQGLKRTLDSLYVFYSSVFSDAIENKVNDQRVLIDKELSDFVKITRWQDMNYWALKASTEKTQKGLFRIVKKFRQFLNQRVDLISLGNSVGAEILSQKSPKELKLSLRSAYKLPEITEARKYLNKMRQLCQKTMKRKFFKNKTNEAIEEFSDEIKFNFNELDKETSQMKKNQDTKASKEDKEKFKKSVKSLLNEKNKFVSDLLKRLAQMGVSYRRGNLECAARQGELRQLIELDVELGEDKLGLGQFLNAAERVYLSSADRFLSFRKSYETGHAPGSTNNDIRSLPVDKFKGYVEHLMHITKEQKRAIHWFIQQANEWTLSMQSGEEIERANSIDSVPIKTRVALNQLINSKCTQLASTLQQLDVYLDTTSVFDGKIRTARDSLKEKLNEERNKFMDLTLFTDDLVKLKFGENKIAESVFEADMSELGNDCCTPFKGLFKELSDELNGIKSEVNAVKETRGTINEEFKLDELREKATKLEEKVLKRVENVFMKYEARDEKIERNFFTESLSDFVSDLKGFDLAEMSSSFKTVLANALSQAESPNAQLDTLKEIFQQFLPFCRFYTMFCTKWSLYLIDNHLKTCQLLQSVLHVFSELFHKGFSLPADAQEADEAGEGNSQQKGKQLDTEEDNPKGLSDDAQGTKDVSEEIENEDELDDAKRPEDREKDEAEKENEEKTEAPTEEEKGIEMSEDFGGEAQDLDLDEMENEENEGGEDDEEPEDEKGDVGRDDDVLDKKLWDNDEDKDEESEPEELDDLEDPKKDLEPGEKTNSEEFTAADALEGEAEEAGNEQSGNEQDQDIKDQKETENEENTEGDDENKEGQDEENKEEMNEDEMDTEIELKDEEMKDEEGEDDVEDVDESKGGEGQVEEEESMEEEEKGEEAGDEVAQSSEKKSEQNAAQKTSSENALGEKESAAAEDNEEDDEKKDNDEDDANANRSEQLSDANRQGKLAKSQVQQAESRENAKRKKPGNKSEERTTVNDEDRKEKVENVELMDVKEEEDELKSGEEKENTNNEFSHVQSKEEKFDREAIDAATEDQKPNKSEKMEEKGEADEERSGDAPKEPKEKNEDSDQIERNENKKINKVK